MRVDGVEDFAPFGRLGEFEEVVLKLGLEVEFALGFFLAVAGDAVPGKVRLGDGLEAFMIRLKGGRFGSSNGCRDQKEEDGGLHECGRPGSQRMMLAISESIGNIGVGRLRIVRFFLITATGGMVWSFGDCHHLQMGAISCNVLLPSNRLDACCGCVLFFTHDGCSRR